MPLTVRDVGDEFLQSLQHRFLVGAPPRVM
jgi:hypothetical protein